MSTKFRHLLAVITTAAVFSVSTVAAAGVVDKAASKLREQKSEQKSDQKADKKSDERSGQSSGGGRNAQPQRDDRVRGSSGSQAPPARDGARDSRGSNGSGNGSGNGSSNGNGGGNRGGNGNGNGDRGPSAGPSPSQGQGSSRDLRDDLSRLYGNNRGNDRDRDHDHRPPRVVERLPAGYRDHNWNGGHYYSHGGHWYRPYGSSYISVGIPIGLFVATLPIYTSFWISDTRYYYADHTYYVYEPVRRGYVVTRSPYGDDEDYYDEGQGEDLYIYPARGQSEQQQADDRYQCHRWAVDQSRYDPLDDEYDTEKRADYRRAMTACLTGRGYSVN